MALIRINTWNFSSQKSNSGLLKTALVDFVKLTSTKRSHILFVHFVFDYRVFSDISVALVL